MSLLNHPDTKGKLLLALTESFQLNICYVPSPSSFWEVHNAFFRGQCIYMSSHRKKDTAFLKTSLLSKLQTAEHSLVLSRTVAWLRAVTSLRNQIKSLDISGIVKSLLWVKQKFYEFSNKPHSMLVSRLNPRPFYYFPDHLKQSDGMPSCLPIALRLWPRSLATSMINYTIV